MDPSTAEAADKVCARMDKPRQAYPEIFDTGSRDASAADVSNMV